VVVIDRSGSMKSYKYLQPAQTDAATFINIMNLPDSSGTIPGDNLGVVAFNESAEIIFGKKTSLIPLKTQTDQDDACAAIMKLSAKGLTNMEKAFKTAEAMLSGATGVAVAEVFLSDGEWNKGEDPLKVVGKIPIYTIALGPSAGTKALEAIATQSHGTYHYAPGTRDLRHIYNSIAGQVPVAALIGSSDENVESRRFVTTSVTVPAGATQATFVFNWDTWDIVFTHDTPTDKEVNVTLYDSNDKKIVPSSTVSGNGFVVFKIANPAAGEYSADAWYGGKGSLSYTAAAFDNNGRITAAITGPQKAVVVGSPATVDFRLADGGAPIDGARVKVSFESPLVTVAEAGAAHAERLKAVSVSEDIPEEHYTAAKIAAFLIQTGEDLLPRELRPMTVQAMSGGLYRIQIPGIEKAGSHTVHVVARGYSAESQTLFQRSTRISFIVSES
jgi:hypothetical protein